MDSVALTLTGAGIGFIKPTKRKLAKASAIKRVLGKGAFSRGSRSSLIVRAASLSTDDLVLLQEQVTAVSNSRQSEDKKEVQVVAEQESDISVTELGPSASLEWRFSRRKLRKRRHIFELWFLCRSQVSGRQSSSSFPCYVYSRAIWHALFLRPQGFSTAQRDRLQRSRTFFWGVLLVGKQRCFWSATVAGTQWSYSKCCR